MPVASNPSIAPKLGRLSSLGPKLWWQTALLLPNGWDDIREVVTDFAPGNFVIGANTVIRGRLRGNPSLKFDKLPRLTGYLEDDSGCKVGFTFFGDTRDLQEQMEASSTDLVMLGIVTEFDGRIWIKNAELVDARWLGRLRPKYPGKTRVINPDLVRDRVCRMLRDAAPRAADWLHENLGEICGQSPTEFAECGEWSLARTIVKAHLPATPEEGLRAQRAMEILAAAGSVRAAASAHQHDQNVAPMTLKNWCAISKRLPFPLTEEQQGAISGILGHIAQGGEPLHAMLSGDVGTGKTAVFGVAAATVFASGGRVAIMLPNQRLAEQVRREFSEWWPKLQVEFVTGESGSEADLKDKPFLIGTQALLFRDVGRRDFVVVDEQQKFSREQREKMVGRTHLLESSATCIPRSMALAKYGALKSFQLTRCHVKKNIRTRIWNQSNKQEMFRGIQLSLQAKGKVLIVYPKREDTLDEDARSDNPRTQLASAENGFASFNAIYPGRVRLSHGGLDSDENEGALAALRSGQADILVATSVVEVGITIPNLRHVVIVSPDRFGLTTLHQIRGRVARDGGEGNCDLYLPYAIKEETYTRLATLTKTQDGFEIAEHDMRLRGFGNLSRESDKQTGADDTFLFGRRLAPEIMDTVIARMEGGGALR